MGTEIASSNYDPVPGLRVGAQIIALNTQTKDNYAWLMMSYFTAGRPPAASQLGYIPKPLHLRSSLPQPSVRKLISIKVISPEEVSVRFFGSEQDMKVNVNAVRDFHVVDMCEGFLMFEINGKCR